MNAYTVVGPTNRQPRRLRSFASAADSGVRASSREPCAVEPASAAAGGSKRQT